MQQQKGRNMKIAKIVVRVPDTRGCEETLRTLYEGFRRPFPSLPSTAATEHPLPIGTLTGLYSKSVYWNFIMMKQVYEALESVSYNEQWPGFIELGVGYFKATPWVGDRFFSIEGGDDEYVVTADYTARPSHVAATGMVEAVLQEEAEAQFFGPDGEEIPVSRIIRSFMTGWSEPVKAVVHRLYHKGDINVPARVWAAAQEKAKHGLWGDYIALKLAAEAAGKW